MEHLSVLEIPRRPYPTASDAQIGHTHAWSRTFTNDDIVNTGVATRDRNPVHFDPIYAAKTRFEKPILHGVATLGEISRALGMDFPGRGTIFAGLEAKFRSPIYPGDTVHFIAKIIEVEPRWGKLTIEITATVQERAVLTARSVVYLEKDTEEN